MFAVCFEYSFKTKTQFPFWSEISSRNDRMSLKPLSVAIRALWRNPSFAIISTLVLVLGIGANTAIFTVINSVLLRPLPYRDADRIVAIKTFWTTRQEAGSVSEPNFRDWQQQNKTLDAVALFDDRIVSVFVDKAAERIIVSTVSGDFFRVFGVEPVLGRTFLPQEEVQGSNPVAVISQDFADRSFPGGNILGRSIKLWQQNFTVVGVLPRGFHFDDGSDIWVPRIWNPTSVATHGSEFRDSYHYDVYGRLKPGVTIERAQADMKTIATRLANTYPEDASTSAVVLGLQDQMSSDIRGTLYLLACVVFLLLLIACSNVANLLLAKLALRGHEFALRVALGSSRGRIIKQLLTEAFVLALPAGALGLLAGWLSAKALEQFGPEGLTKLGPPQFDWRVAAFAFFVACISTVMFGVAPALKASATNVNETLRQGGSHGVVRGGMGRLRAGIIVFEIAISMSLLIGATLLIRTLSALSKTDRGYRVESIWVMDSIFPAATIEDSRRAVVFYDQLLQDAKAIPGMKKVAGTSYLPNRSTASGKFSIEGRSDPAPGNQISQQAGFILVSPDYFQTLEIALMSGRTLNDNDRAETPLTCLVNTALVRAAFPHEDPIGRRIKTGLDGTDYMTIVGIVADIRQKGIEQLPTPIIYMPFQQHPLAAKSMKILFHSAEDPSIANRELLTVSTRLDPEVAIRFLPLTDVLDRSLAPSRFRSTILGVLAGLALILALGGLYGVMSYAVAQRRPEFGVRVALGAQRREIIALVLTQGSRLIVPGILLGAIIGLAFNKVMMSFVYGVKTTDPAVYVGVAAILGAVALCALYVPALRAASVDPMQVMRSQE